MDNIAREMQRIRDEVVNMRGIRETFISELKESSSENRRQASAMINEFRKNRAENARSDNEKRMSFASGLRRQVSETINEFGVDRSRMAAKTKAELSDFTSGVRHSVQELRKDTGELLRSFENERMEISRETRAGLVKFFSDLRSSIVEMLIQIGSERKETTKQIRAMLEKSQSERKETTKQIRAMLEKCLTDTRRFVADIKNTAEADSRVRKERVSGLKKDVNALRVAMARDLREAGEIWRGAAASKPAAAEKISQPEVREQKAEEEAAPVTATPAEQPSKEESMVSQEESAAAPEVREKSEKSEIKEEIIPDDLTLIPEIGPSRARNLNDAGIFTLEQLAGADLQMLKEVFKDKGKAPDFKMWVREAKKLISGKD